ncbi:hypothetical protein JHS3_27580 [Jeongeupia sp. HS-3]|nr:hypothetical protein JHS3_27580 [Jeongeupia sp. HS-3]
MQHDKALNASYRKLTAAPDAAARKQNGSAPRYAMHYPSGSVSAQA